MNNAKQHFDILVQRRVEVRELLRLEWRALDAFQGLPDKAWAREWRAARSKPVLRRIKRLQGELARLDRVLGPSPALWRPKPADAATREIAKRFREVGQTASAW